MEAQSLSPAEVLPISEHQLCKEPPNCVKNNCENTPEPSLSTSDAPAMEGSDEGTAIPTVEEVNNSSSASKDKQQPVESKEKADAVINDKVTVVHIEPVQKESIALDKPKRQRKKKEPKDYDAITSSSFCHMIATSPTRMPNKSPSRGGRSPGRGGHSPARSPARSGQSPVRSPARGGQSPARSGHSPARGGQSPAHDCQSPAHSNQSPAHSNQSPAHGGQSPDCSPAHGGNSPAHKGQNPANGGLSPGQGSQSPACSVQSPSKGSSVGDESMACDDVSPTHDDHSTIKISQSPTHVDTDVMLACDGQTAVNGTECSAQNGHSPSHNLNHTAHNSGDSCTDCNQQEQETTTLQTEHHKTDKVTAPDAGSTTTNSNKPVKKKAARKKPMDNGPTNAEGCSYKEREKKAKKRKSSDVQTEKNTSDATSKNSSREMKVPIVNNKHSDVTDHVNEQSEPKKKKRKKAVKSSNSANMEENGNLEKENTNAENLSKSKKKCVRKKKILDSETDIVAKDSVETADTLDTITAVLNHVVAESTKCCLEHNIDTEKPVKSKKKTTARKKSQLPKVDKVGAVIEEKTVSDSVQSEATDSQTAASVVNDNEKTEKEKKPKKKKLVITTEEGDKQKSDSDCKPKKKKPVKSKIATQCGDSVKTNHEIGVTSEVPSDKTEPLVVDNKDSSVPPSEMSAAAAGSVSVSSSDQCAVVLENIAATEQTTSETDAHCVQGMEQPTTENSIPEKGDTDKKQGDNEKLNQEASEGSKKDEGVVNSGSSSENRVFQCSKCSYNSKKKVSLRRHMTVHGVYECAHCEFVSDQNSVYEDHMRDNHPSRYGRKLCKKCNVLFRVDEIEQHEKECTGEKKKWTCSECKKEFKFLCTMRAHVQKWHVSSGIKCDKCEFEANTNYTLKKHILKVHKPMKEKKPIVCSECNKTFSSDSCYRQHMKLHEGQEFQCPKCGKVFKSTRSMQTHLKIHEETKSVPCEVEGCTKVFKNAKVMEIHRKRCHENEPKKFKCTYGTCEQRFYTKYHLKRHEIMHTGERNYKCTYPDCTKAFHHAENLKVHLRSHNNIKCPQCRRTFKEESSLQTHLKVHENAKSRSKKKRKQAPTDSAEKPKSDAVAKPDTDSASSAAATTVPTEAVVETGTSKTDKSDVSEPDTKPSPGAESHDNSGTQTLNASEKSEQTKKEDSGPHDVYDFHDSDDEKLAVSAISRQTSPNKSPRIKVGGELLGTLPLPSAPDAMLAKSVAMSGEESQTESSKKKKKKVKKKKVAEENTGDEKPADESENKPKEKKKATKKKKVQEGDEKEDESPKKKKEQSTQNEAEAKEGEKQKKVKKPKKKAEKKNKEKETTPKKESKCEDSSESETKAKKKKSRKKNEKEQEVREDKDKEAIEPEKKKKKKKKPKKCEEPVSMETSTETHQDNPASEPAQEVESQPELEAEPAVDTVSESQPDDHTKTEAEALDEELPEKDHDDEDTKPEEEQQHQSEPEIGPQPSPTPEYLDDQQHGFFSPRPEQVEFQYPMAPRPVSPEEDDDDIDMMEMEQSYNEEQQKQQSPSPVPDQKDSKVLESPLSEMSSEMKSLTLPTVSRESPGAGQEDNDHHSDLVAGLSPTIKDINGQEDEMLNDIAKQVEAESAIAEDETTEMPPSNYPSSIHTTPPSVQPPSVPPSSVPPPPQEVPVITSHTSHIMEESSAIGDMVSRYEGEAATRDLYQAAPLSNSSSTQQQSSHHYSGMVEQQLSHKYLQEAPLSVQSRGPMLPDETPTPTSSSPPSIPPPPAKYYMDGSSYPPSVYHSHRVPSVPPSDLPPTSPSGPAETTPTYSDSLSHGSSHYRSDSQACPSYPPRDSLPPVTTPSYSSPPQNSYLDPHSASMVNNKEDVAVPSVSNTERTSDSMYLTSRSSNVPASATEALPTNSSAPPSVSFGSDSLPSRELLGQYFGQDSTGSMPLTHPPLSQEQRGLPYPHSQPQTSLPTLPGANSADYFRRASAPFIPGTGYPSVTETLVPPPPQHWMSAHDERSRQWGQPSPIIPPPIPSELDSTSPLSRNPYVSRPSDYSFNPTTTSHSSKQTDSSYPGSQSISTPGERATYDMTSAYMTSRTFNPNYTGPMPPPPAATQKQLEEAYRRAAQISDYRTLSQAAPPSMADMYSRMAVPPALGFDKYYYPRDAMFRSQHLSAAPNPFMTQSSTPQMPYTERDYGRNPIYTQHSAYGFMGDKQYLASNKLPPALPGLQERPMPADYLQGPAAAAAMGDPHIQDPYRRSVIYNMMSRYF